VGGWDKIVNNVAAYYDENTPQRTKLIDVFMAFLALAGALQFLYCVLAGNFVRARAALPARFARPPRGGEGRGRLGGVRWHTC